MTDYQLKPADAALQAKITELSVHIRCGQIRGPLQRKSRYYPHLPIRWQSCRCEATPQEWVGCDVSQEFALCIVCFRATAGGTSRWSWLACENCRKVNQAAAEIYGIRPLALGRHSLMNGIGVRGGVSAEVQEEQMTRLLDFVKGDVRVRRQRDQEYVLLASSFEADDDVPLRVWQQEYPPSLEASIAAFRRLFGDELPGAGR